MFSFVIDEEITLRLLTELDAEDFFALTQKNKRYLEKFMPRIRENDCLEKTKNVIKSFLEQYVNNNGFRAGIVYKSKLVGVVGFKYIDLYNNKTEIMYWIDQDVSGNGITSKCVEAMVKIAFDNYNLNKVTIKASVDNIASKKVAEKNGFVLEAIHKEDEKLLNGYADTCVYGLTKNGRGD